MNLELNGKLALVTMSKASRLVDVKRVPETVPADVAKVRASFIGSDRTYGARRVWRDLLAEGVSCGLHRIERLMRLQALRARPRRRRLPPDLG